MKIFGKRPFVLKTSEMNDKINAIKGIDNYKEVENKLGDFISDAALFGQMQKEASGIKKDKNLNLGDKELSLDLNNLLNHFCFLDSRGNLRETLKKNLTEELVKYFETFEQDTPDERGKVDHDDFVKKVGELEKKCREAKQKFKDIFEEVSKALKSYIKKLEKVNKANEKGKSEEDIKQVAKSELDVFKKYEISLEDEGCSESEKHCEKGNDAFEETNIEISEDDNLLVGKV